MNRDLIALLDGDGITEADGSRTGFHSIIMEDGAVPVASVPSYGSTGSTDDGPVVTVTEEQAAELALMFARSPRVEAAAWALVEEMDARIAKMHELGLLQHVRGCANLGNLRRALEGRE
jgi:hypothetical protein